MAANINLNNIEIARRRFVNIQTDRAADRAVLIGHGWTDAQVTTLRNVLVNLNGEGNYHAVGSTIGFLPQNEYFRITQEILNRVHYGGANACMARRSDEIMDLALVAALQYEKLEAVILNVEHRLYVSIIRALIFLRGPLNAQGVAPNVIRNEVEIVENGPANETVTIFTNWFRDNANNAILSDLNELSIFAPIFASIQFIKTNHHYITGSDYDTAYDNHFRSATKSHLRNILPYNLLFHTAIHWMGPYAGRVFSLHMLEANFLPDGTSKKVQSAPAGCAVLTSVLAVFHAMSSLPIYQYFEEAFGERIDRMRVMREEIMRHPTAFHLHATLFGTPSRRNEANFVNAIRDAESLTCFTQAFVDAMCAGSPLGGVKTMKKHAENNHGVYIIATAGFRRWSRNLRQTADIGEAIRRMVNAPVVAEANPQANVEEDIAEEGG